MFSRNIRWVVVPGLAAVGGFAIWKHLGPNERLRERMEELEEERQEMAKRTDQPAEAAAYYVNCRTGGWVTTGARGVDPRAMAVPLDTSLYLPAIRQANLMNQYSTATNSILGPQGDNPPAVALGGGLASPRSVRGRALHRRRLPGERLEPGPTWGCPTRVAVLDSY